MINIKMVESNEEEEDEKERKDDAQKVIVTDIHMPFWSMVIFMVRWAVASVPAFIILVFIGFFLMGILRGLLG
jgi:hypothetical protein